MALTQLAPPYPVFTDKNGDPLDNGYLYFGEVNKNPETNSIQVYYDSGLTQPVAQPVRTSNGYPMRNGAPALIYAGSQFSVTVRDKNSDLVIYSPVGYGIDPGAIAGVVIVQDQIGDGVTTAFGMGASPATENATNVFIDGVYQSKAGYSISGSTLTFSEAPPLYSAIEIVSNETAIIGGGTDASLVTYNEGGAGAVTRTVQTKLQETVSVKDFGAVGDGVTDDTAAIQAAIDSVATSASVTLTVNIPDGNYLVTDTIEVLKRNVYLVGQSEAGTKIKFRPSSEIPCIEMGTRTSYTLNLGITNLTVEGADPSGTSVGSHGILLNTPHFATLENVRVIRFNKPSVSNGIYIRADVSSFSMLNKWRGVIDGCWNGLVIGSQSDGIYTGPVNVGRFEGRITADNIGVHFDKGYDNTLAESDVELAAIGVKVDSAGNNVVNTVVEQCTEGYKVSDSPASGNLAMDFNLTNRRSASYVETDSKPPINVDTWDGIIQGRWLSVSPKNLFIESYVPTNYSGAEARYNSSCYYSDGSVETLTPEFAFDNTHFVQKTWYTLSFYAKTDAAVSQNTVAIRLRTTSDYTELNALSLPMVGNPNTENGRRSSSMPTDGVWRRYRISFYSGTETAFPSDMRIRFAGTWSGGNAYVDGVQLQEGTCCTEYTTSSLDFKSSEGTLVTPSVSGTVTSQTFLEPKNQTVLFTTSTAGGAYLIYLPAASDTPRGTTITVQRADSNPDTVRAQVTMPNTSDTINGSTRPYSVPAHLDNAYASLTFVCDGVSEWFVTAKTS